MRVRFWGTRGSIPVPGAETLRYGGNTSCVEVLTEENRVFIFDCGTGARKLGMQLARGGPVRANLFIGHTHSDHIQGLPFFVPAFLPGSRLTIYGPSGIDRSFPNAIGGQMEYSYFPVPMQDLPSEVDFVELGEGVLTVDRARVRTQFLNHTAPCLGYRMEVGGISMVYATDHEPHSAQVWRPDRDAAIFDPAAILHPGDVRHAHFMRDADLLIHDAQYTADEYPSKVGWGHSTVEYVVDLALAAGVRRLALFHHDPSRSDEDIDVLLARSRERVAASGISMDVFAAAEGLEVELAERPWRPATTGTADAAWVPALVKTSILVVDDDEDVRSLLAAALRQDGHQVLPSGDGPAALTAAQAQRVDLILLDVQMPGMDGLATCRAMRAIPALTHVPIIMLTARTDQEDVLAGLAEGATDYMTKPFAVSQLRARVRSWLARSGAVRTKPSSQMQ